MRWLRASVLVAAMACASRWVVSLLVGPVLEGWRLVTAATSATTPSGSGAVTTVVVGCSCALLLVAWGWLVAAVGACAWDALRGGPHLRAAAAPSLLHPRLLRAVVVTALGATALATPAAHAGTVTTTRALPDDVDGVSAGPVVPRLELLDGLPAPDRVTGAGPGPALDQPPDSRRHRGPPAAGAAPGRAVHTSAAGPAARALLVRPGDSLWTLTAGLLPADASAETVARGWQLLYAANRAVVGSDPDLLHPGQSLRLGDALLDLVRSAHDASGPDRQATRVDRGR